MGVITVVKLLPAKVLRCLPKATLETVKAIATYRTAPTVYDFSTKKAKDLGQVMQVGPENFFTNFESKYFTFARIRHSKKFHRNSIEILTVPYGRTQRADQPITNQYQLSVPGKYTVRGPMKTCVGVSGRTTVLHRSSLPLSAT